MQIVLLYGTDYGHTMAKSLILYDPISQIPLPNKQLGFVFSFFLEMKTSDKGLTVPKWPENTENFPKCICPNCLPKLKSLGFQWKKDSLYVHSPCCTDRVGNIYFLPKKLFGSKKEDFWPKINCTQMKLTNFVNPSCASHGLAVKIWL